MKNLPDRHIGGPVVFRLPIRVQFRGTDLPLFSIVIKYHPFPPDIFQLCDSAAPKLPFVPPKVRAQRAEPPASSLLSLLPLYRHTA
jgi:hypothetical protein